MYLQRKKIVTERQGLKTAELFNLLTFKLSNSKTLKLIILEV
jgi:hypothetical protein